MVNQYKMDIPVP